MRKPKTGWELLCAHANEVPAVCPCDAECGCRYYYSCKLPDVGKEENELKAKLVEKIRLDIPRAVICAHQEIRNVGWPDLEVNLAARTSHWECKHGTPNFESHGRQELTMLRLAAASFYARYIIWHSDRDGRNKRTLIVHPKYIGSLEPEAFCIGFDHHFVTQHMRKVHGI